MLEAEDLQLEVQLIAVSHTMAAERAINVLQSACCCCAEKDLQRHG